jgi:lysophospholipase L1-like esterase
MAGVMVDNLPVRGSAGLFFGRFDFGLTAQMYSAMNVRLILLQFGGNAVGRDSSNIAYYVQMFGKQMEYLHKLAPKAQIIVIGPADMSEKQKNNYVTRSNLPYLVDLLRKEALSQNCAFWNMYEAMGGENSMPSWVFHDPPLAEKDFVHFTPKGADIIAKMFYKALVADYNKFVISER